MSKQQVKTCKHAKVNGSLCESPALREQDYCYFHTSQRQRIRRQRRAVRLHMPLQLPLLEDASSIQLAINDVLNALLAGQIDHKTAGLLLRGLQTAAVNIRRADFDVNEFEHQYVVYHERENDLLEAEIAADIKEEKKLEKIAAKKIERKRQREAAKSAPVTATGESGTRSGLGVQPPSVPVDAPTLPAKKPAASVVPEPANASQAVGEAMPTIPSRSDGRK